MDPSSLGVKIDPPSPDEIVLEVPAKESLSLFGTLVRLHLDILATTYLLAEDSLVHVWVLDIGNRTRNIVLADILGSHVRLTTKSKGNRILYHRNKNLTSYQFRAWIQELQQRGVQILAHSPLHEFHTQYVYF